MTEQEKREKVMAGLECCKGECLEPSEGKCPYYPDTHGDRCFHTLISDALELLKAQEPMLVVNIHKAYNNVLNPNVPWVGKCPKCGKKVSGKNLTRFCMYCGQAVKWE